MDSKEKIRNVINGCYRAGKEQWGRFKGERISELKGMQAVLEAQEDQELATMCKNFSEELRASFPSRRNFRDSRGSSEDFRNREQPRFESRPESRFKVGTKILRDVDLTKYPPQLIDHLFDKTDSGDVVFKAVFDDRSEHPVALPASLDNKGMTCFCRDKIDQSLIYFEVVQVHRNGKSVIVKVVAGNDDELVEMYDAQEKPSNVEWIEKK